MQAENIRVARTISNPLLTNKPTAKKKAVTIKSPVNRQARVEPITRAAHQCADRNEDIRKRSELLGVFTRNNEPG